MRRGRLFIIVGLILAVVTAAGAFLLLNQQPKTGPAAPQQVETKRVAVAVQNIEEGQPILPEAIRMTDWAKDQVPPGAILNQADVAGKLARVPIYQGQVLQQQMLLDKNEMAAQGTYASWMIPRGKVAVAFPVTRLGSVAYALRAGDFVDVLVTMHMVDLDPETQVKLPVVRIGAEGGVAGQQTPRQVTQLTLQNVQVLHVGEWNPEVAVDSSGAQPKPTPAPQQSGQATPVPRGPDVITLVVDQQDALVLKFARESGAVIDLALRARDDHDQVSTESVTLDYVVRRFNIAVPPKQPFAIESPGSVGTTDGQTK